MQLNQRPGGTVDHSDVGRTRSVRLAIVGFKFVSGAAELAAGFSLLILPPSLLRLIFNLASSQELREDPTDRIVILIQHRLPQLLGAKHLLAFGLIVIGMVKVVGAVGLLRSKPWGYYLLVIMLGTPLPFDLFHLVGRRSPLSVALLVANSFVLGLLLMFRSTLVAREQG